MLIGVEHALRGRWGRWGGRWGGHLLRSCSHSIRKWAQPKLALHLLQQLRRRGSHSLLLVVLVVLVVLLLQQELLQDQLHDVRCGLLLLQLRLGEGLRLSTQVHRIHAKKGVAQLQLGDCLRKLVHRCILLALLCSLSSSQLLDLLQLGQLLQLLDLLQASQGVGSLLHAELLLLMCLLLTRHMGLLLLKA